MEPLFDVIKEACSYNLDCVCGRCDTLCFVMLPEIGMARQMSWTHVLLS